MILDTHILLWLVNGDPIPSKTKKAIHTSAYLAISAITAWEIFMLEKRGKVNFNIPSAAWLGQALRTHNIDTIPLGISICHRSNRLAWEHRDPADRFIVATAIETDLPLATCDDQIIQSRVVPVAGYT